MFIIEESLDIESLKESLTGKQKMFCEEYLVDFNGTRAATAAGYSEKTGYSIAGENLKKPEIQAYIKHLTENRNKRVHVDVDYVVGKLKTVADICSKENDLGNIDSTGANKSLELLGKHLGMYIDKTESSSTVTVKREPTISFDDEPTE